MNERYSCPRCGYKTDRKAYLKRHLQRKRICPTTLQDICIEEIYSMYFGDDLTELYTKQVQDAIYNISENECAFCGKTFSRKASVKRHIETTCLKNPLTNPTNIKYKKINENFIINDIDSDTEDPDTTEQSIDEKITEGDNAFVSSIDNKDNYINNAILEYKYGSRQKLDTCIEEDCSNLARYNYTDQICGVLCSKHTTQNMINVISGKCKNNNCGTRACFNFSEETTPIYCGEHKKDTMINVYSKKCIKDNCIQIASCNYSGEITPIYCIDHMYENMVNIRGTLCKNCADWPDSRMAQHKYNGHCTRCFQQLFPTDPLTLSMKSKTKEIAVRDFINSNFIKFQHDKPLYTGNCDCTHRRRIDHRRLIDNTILAIETDENQHKSYDKNDEEIRYDDLYMVHSGKWIFIRFNPDNYKNSNGQNKQTKLETRLKTLEKEIKYQIFRIVNEENTDLVEIIHLFYDGYDN